jgi:hypothetical protein
MPLSLGEDTMRVGVVSGLRAALMRSPVPLDSLSLVYGDFFDVTASLIEVTTIFRGYGWPGGVTPSDLPASACALGHAELRDREIARGAWSVLPVSQESAPEGPFTHHIMAIMACGTRRAIPVVSYRNYQALSFSEGTTGVTVVSRNPLPDLPQFNWVTDLEPYFAGWTRHMHEVVERTGPLTT